MSKPTKPKTRKGRPGLRAYQFAAHLLSIRTGQNEKYCRQLIDECVSELDATGWALVALSLKDEGDCETLDDFREWLADLGISK
jgi:hypothetical protein